MAEWCVVGVVYQGRVVCKSCHEIYTKYRGQNIDGLITSDELERENYTCSNCGKPLKVSTRFIVQRTLEEMGLTQ